MASEIYITKTRVRALFGSTGLTRTKVREFIKDSKGRIIDIVKIAHFIIRDEAWNNEMYFRPGTVLIRDMQDSHLYVISIEDFMQYYSLEALIDSETDPEDTMP